jgi:hypothetical protein
MNDQKKPDRDAEKYHTLPGLYRNACVIQRIILAQEYVRVRKRETEEYREEIHKEALRLVNLELTTDEELITKFTCGLFANPSVWMGICQQWEAIGSHIVCSGGLVGEGKIWTILLHTLVCSPRLELGIVPIFQQYQTMVYPYGMDSCTMVELLLSNPNMKALFRNTPLDVPSDQLVTSPAFLRFDVSFLPVLSCRIPLCCLRTRKCFTDTSFQHASDTCYRMRNLDVPTHYIYTKLFEHFRPCLVAALMVSLCWAAHKRGPIFVSILSETIRSFIRTIESISDAFIEICRDDDDDDSEGGGIKECALTDRGHFRKSNLLRMAENMRILGDLVQRYFHRQVKTGDYSLKMLHAIYADVWKTLNVY